MKRREDDLMNGSQCLNVHILSEQAEREELAGLRQQWRWLALTFRALDFGYGMAQERESKKPVVVAPDGSVLVFETREEAGEWLLHSQCHKRERSW